MSPLQSRTRFLFGGTAVVVGVSVGLVAFQGQSSSGVVRTYYIAAAEVEWDYAPSGMNRITGEPFGPAEAMWMESGPFRIGRVYKKALYYEYTDATFTERKPRPPEWEHLGMLGPLIRAEVGDTIVVVFRNNAAFPASVHPHGVFYDKDSEGAPYVDQTGGPDKNDDVVPTGGTHTYTWPVPERAGPAEGDPSSILWMYHSHTNDVRDVNSGLMGPMIVSAEGTTRPDGTPRDVDRELIVTFQEVFENESWYIEENIERYTGNPEAQTIIADPFGGPIIVAEGSQGLGDYNLMQSLNGLVYGNLEGLTMKVGERVRWYVMATTNFELHSPHWHGNVVTIGEKRTDVAALLTMGMLVADMVPDNPGEWLFHCHTGPHLVAGMQATYTVESTETTGGG